MADINGRQQNRPARPADKSPFAAGADTIDGDKRCKGYLRKRIVGSGGYQQRQGELAYGVYELRRIRHAGPGPLQPLRLEYRGTEEGHVSVETLL